MGDFTMQTARGWIVAILLIFAFALSVTGTAYAQGYPNRDLTFIVPYAPGGATDPISRQFAVQLEKALRGNVNVENKPGGSGTIGVGAIVRSKPDGYTIGLGSATSLVYQAIVNRNLAWKTVDDYQPIVKLCELPNVLFVRADAPWKTFEEFLAEVRKHPGKIRASVPGLRTGPDLTVQQFNQIAGVKIATIPFTGGSGEATIALLGGRVESQSSSGATNLGHVQAGKLRALAVFQKGKYEPFPQATPAFHAYGKATLLTMYCVIAPKGMARDVQDKLVAASLQSVRSEEFMKVTKASGYVLDAKGPEALKAELMEYSKGFSDVIKFLDQK